MPAITAGAIIVGATKVATIISGIDASINIIRTIKGALERIRTSELKRCWCNTTNDDSKIFTQRMEELDADIQKALRDLDEYMVMLQKVKTEYEKTQQNSISEGSSLKRPGAR